MKRDRMVTDAEEIANQFNNYFINTGTDLSTYIPNDNCNSILDCMSTLNMQSMFFGTTN